MMIEMAARERGVEEPMLISLLACPLEVTANNDALAEHGTPIERT